MRGRGPGADEKMRRDRTSLESPLEGMIRRKLVAVIRSATPEQALASAEALAAGGITSLEISLAMPEGIEVLRALAPRHGLTVGAGNVLGKDQAEAALEAQARFVVCPVADLSLVSLCREAGAVSVIGALTPSEILTAHRAGADVVNIFPIEALGGIRFVKAVLEGLPPFPLRIEGGVTLENLADYLGLPVQLIGVGENLIVPRLVAKGAYATVTARARDFVLQVEKRKAHR